MPNILSHQSAQTTKLLLIGDSGAGKTGSLISLADAGYNLRILDFDNGADLIANILRDGKSDYKPECAKNIEFETLTDPMKIGPAGKLIPGRATVWQRAMKLLDNWKTETADLGPISSWTAQDVLAIDSLTMLSTAALNHVLAMNNSFGKMVEQSHWYAAQQLVEGLLQMLYDVNVKCNVVITSHITFIGDENNLRGYPNTLGKALPPKVGRYFNTTLLAKTQGQGSAERRKIFTRTSGIVELKNTAPTRVKPDYPIETGLADYFRDVRGEPSKP